MNESTIKKLEKTIASVRERRDKLERAFKAKDDVLYAQEKKLLEAVEILRQK